MVALTDAALGLPVMTNPRLPSRIRQGLNVESGLNDGVCVPLPIIFLTVAQAEGIGHVEPVKVILKRSASVPPVGSSSVPSATGCWGCLPAGGGWRDLAAHRRGGDHAAGLHGGGRAGR
jgi:hypothetical protein